MRRIANPVEVKSQVGLGTTGGHRTPRLASSGRGDHLKFSSSRTNSSVNISQSLSFNERLYGMIEILDDVWEFIGRSGDLANIW